MAFDRMGIVEPREDAGVYSEGTDRLNSLAELGQEIANERELIDVLMVRLESVSHPQPNKTQDSPEVGPAPNKLHIDILIAAVQRNKMKLHQMLSELSI